MLHMVIATSTPGYYCRAAHSLRCCATTSFLRIYWSTLFFLSFFLTTTTTIIPVNDTKSSMSPTAIHNAQPTSQGLMAVNPDLYQDFHLLDEKRNLQQLGYQPCQHHHHGIESNNTNHRGCHYTRLRKLLFPAALIALVLTGLVAWLCYDSMASASLMALGESVIKRDTTGNNNVFIDRKCTFLF